MKFSTTSLLISLCAFTSQALAHGYVRNVVIDGKSYPGNKPNQKPQDSIVRQITTSFPIKGAQNVAMTCGEGSKPAALSASAKPGSKVSFDWAGGDDGNWPHDTGPMLTYMASCGTQDCSKFDASKAKWFKIQEVGRKASGQLWAQADLLKGQAADITLPTNISPGNYLLRHEIIGLHIAESRGGAEFYASCTQVKIGGNGTGAPAANELVSFPGAYSDDDKGIVGSNFFDRAAKYNFPGPVLAKLAGSASSSSGTETASAPTGTKAPSKSPCSRRKTSSGAVLARAERRAMKLLVEAPRF